MGADKWHRIHLHDEILRIYADSAVATEINDASLDIRGDIRRCDLHEGRFVAKRRSSSAANDERFRAGMAHDRLTGLVLPNQGSLTVVVPTVVELPDGMAALVSPDLGSPMSCDLDATATRLPLADLRTILDAMRERGVDASGFVPRNLFDGPGGLAVIDWEDARFVDGGMHPSTLSLMKWDIGWSDVYRQDPGLRTYFQRMPLSDDVAHDEFEVALADLLDRPQEPRAWGIEATLHSELHVPGTGGISAAAIGHLAEDVLGVRLGVLHTALTAHIRRVCGDARYSAVLNELWAHVSRQLEGSSASPRADSLSDIAANWLRQLSQAADLELNGRSDGPTVTDAAEGLREIAGTPGWDAALKRADLAEVLLSRLAELTTATFDLDDLQLILRGSLAQGVLSIDSDLDFELSSPDWPQGHRAVEALLIDLLAAFGLEGEGSAARPTESDLACADPRVTRDLHEWMELRRPGSSQHDPGWLRGVLDPDDNHLAEHRSQYELLGRQSSAKYLWFEARAATARLVFRTHPARPPVTLPEQLAHVTTAIDSSAGDDLTEVVWASFTQRDQLTPTGSHELHLLRKRLDVIRGRYGLPGPHELPDHFTLTHEEAARP